SDVFGETLAYLTDPDMLKMIQLLRLQEFESDVFGETLAYLTDPDMLKMIQLLRLQEFEILLDHPLSYAMIATTDVPIVYSQQIWQTVHKVPDTKDTIRFELDTQEITYRDTFKLSVETPDNSFVVPATIEIIESFMNRVGYQGVVDK
nr:hypothetical protein [Tanacetum cinerariifolium]